MNRGPKYEVATALADEFVDGQRHGYLVAVGADGFPRTSIVPFVREGDVIDLHIPRTDPTFDALSANLKVTFLVADYLAHSPHQWVDPNDAGRSTLHFRAVEFLCEATASTEPDDVAASLRKLITAYDGQGDHQPIADGDFYGPRLRLLAAVSLRIVSSQARFKTGPYGSPELKRTVIERLRERAAPGDERAAAVIESYLPR